MPSRSANAQIRAEIERLEDARKQCSDEGIRKVIEEWITELRKTLAGGAKKDS